MRLHHVNLAVHPDLLDAEIAFLVDGLGLVRVDPGPALADRARWFEFADGTQVHLSRTPEPVLTKPGHVAVVVGDAFAAVVGRLAALGLESRTIDGMGFAIALYDDPAGHLWEVRADAS